MTNRTAGYIAATVFATLSVIASGIGLEWRVAHPETPDLSRFAFWSSMAGSFGTMAVRFLFDARCTASDAEAPAPTPPADAPASYREQAIDGDGNVQSAGDIVGGCPDPGCTPGRGRVEMVLNGHHVKATSPSRISLSGREGGGFVVASNGVQIEVWR